MTVSCLRDQVELADGDALVPVAHFSKEVCFFVSFYFVATTSFVQCSICWYFKFQVFSTFGSPFLVLMRQVRIVPALLYICSLSVQDIEIHKFQDLMLTFVQGDTVGRVKERMQERLGVNDKVPFS